MLSTIFIGLVFLVAIITVFTYASKKGTSSTETEFHFEFAKIVKLTFKSKSKSTNNKPKK